MGLNFRPVAAPPPLTPGTQYDELVDWLLEHPGEWAAIEGLSGNSHCGRIRRAARHRHRIHVNVYSSKGTYFAQYNPPPGASS